MNRDKKSFIRQMILGAILSSLLIGIDVRPAQAQWTVFDPSQYALQVAKRVEEASRWVETINHYIRTYEQAVRQYEKMVESVTNLRGILDTVDEQVMRHKQLITTYATLGRLIRGTFELKKRIEATITSQIHSVVNIARRLKNGIFDMEANKRDLDDFLRHSIGRSADAHLANGLKIEQMTEFGKEIRRTTEMMAGIAQASDSFLRELERYEVWDEDVYQSPLP